MKYILITLLLYTIVCHKAEQVGTPSGFLPNNCDTVWPTEISDKSCTGENSQPNLPILNGAYCYNNGSGLCKAFAGRFEFYFNTFTDEILGPVPSSQYVDSNGYHERIPISYDLNGMITYSDRSINWASAFVKALAGKPLSLLSLESINWCAYTEKSYWPYRSAIKEPSGRYHLYFFNRQSCIYDTQHSASESGWQHYNTRFLHNSSLRIDLDMNPLIFAMEDNIAEGNKIRLVKHKRQHWYEVEFEVLKDPAPDINYFVKMESNERLPCKITSGKPLITAASYKRFTNKCVSDHYHIREGKKNARLVPSDCGLDQAELTDVPILLHQVKVSPSSDLLQSVSLDADLHNLPRHPPVTVENFYGATARSDNDWKEFAKDGFVLSATTTIPVKDSNDSVRVLSLYAEFNDDPKDRYDESYPRPYLADYIATVVRKGPPNVWDWSFDRNANKKELKNLNYVDDIAYLYGCEKILIIFGPLYNALGVDEFDVATQAPLGSIVSLDIFEMVNAFLALPDQTLWVYHRTNYLTDHSYSCSGGPYGTVSAKKKSGKYYVRHGVGAPAEFVQYTSAPIVSEETLFQRLEVFRGSNNEPEAPDPRKYPLPDGDPALPIPYVDNSWVYIMIAIAALIIVALCIICALSIRRRRIHDRHKKGISSTMTTRSSLLPGSQVSMTPTQRSSAIRSSSSRSRPKLTSGVSRASTPRSTLRSTSSRRPSSVASSKRSSSLSPARSGSRATRRSGSLRTPSRSSRATNRSRL